jgi:peptidoglycan/LPS O-acetylase OafA/YrhL
MSIAVMERSMARAPSDIVPVAIAVVAGVLSWDLVRLLGERREAWDDPDYWLVAFPLMLFTAFLLGLAFRDRPWRWVAAMLGAQAAWALLLSVIADGAANPFPLGLLVFALLAVPCLAVAYAGRMLGERAQE